MYKILLVEDDPTITEVLERQLAKWGYEASHVTDFQHVLETFVQQAPHLVLLDISLPFYDGYHWCGEIRKISKTPVLFISSASDNMNLVMALNMGGDDFLAKPFDLNVAIAKIEALLRRTYDFGAGVNALACRGAVLDLKDASLHYNSQKLELTKNEFRILQLLFERRAARFPGRTSCRPCGKATASSTTIPSRLTWRACVPIWRKSAWRGSSAHRRAWVTCG